MNYRNQNPDLIGIYPTHDVFGAGLAFGGDVNLLGDGSGAPMVDPAAVANAVAAREAVMVGQRQLSKSRREFLGFGNTCVDGGETVDIVAEPQVDFKAYRLIIPSSQAFNFVIEQIRFGKWNLFANSGSVPAAAFIETAEDTTFNPDTVATSGKITLTVKNITNVPQNFSAMMIGWAVE